MYETSSDGVSTALLANPSLTRRTLFSLTAVVGALHFLGSAQGGRVVAYADDEGEAHFVIVVLSKEEIGVQVIDLEHGGAAIGDAHVVVTSRYNGKTVEGTTSADGIAVLNVKALSQQCDENDPEEYSFHGGADVTVDKYRGFAFTNTFIIAGPQQSGKTAGRAHIFLPTQPYDPAKDSPYLRMGCFDGNDLLHNVASMGKYADNTIDHTFEFQVACSAGTQVECSVYAKQEGAAARLFAGPVRATADKQGIAFCSMSGPYIKDAAVGTTFECRYTVSGTTYATDLHFTVTEPDIDLTGPYFAQNWTVSLGSGGSPDPNAPKTQESKGFYLGQYEKRRIFLPKLPFGSDITITGDLPWFPVDFVVDPRGGIGLSFRASSFSLFSKEMGKPAKGPDVNKWLKSMKEPCDSYFDRRWGDFDKKLADFEKARQNAKDHKRGLGGKMFGGIDLSIDFEGLLKAYFLNPKGKEIKTWEGTMGACLTGLLKGELGATVAAGPVPVFVGWDFTLRVSFGVEAGVSFTPAFKDPKWFFMSGGSHGEGGWSVFIYFDTGFSAGVGLRGIASVFARGYCTIPMTFTFQKVENKPFPHKEIKLQIGLQVGTQVLFITFSTDAISPLRKVLLDNWDKKALEDPSNTGEGEAESILDFFDDAYLNAGQVEGYTTDVMLGDVAEIEAIVNEQGVACQYDMSGLSLPDIEEMAAEKQGMQDPFAANAAYDVRKGLRPNIEVPFVAPGADGDAPATVFSDTRSSIVELNGMLYFCRVASVAFNLAHIGDAFEVKSGLYQPDDIFLVPSDHRQAIPCLTYEAGAEGEVGAFGLTGSYDEVYLYRDDIEKSAPVVSQVQVPICSVYAEEGVEIDPAMKVTNDVDDINGRMEAIAEALGWRPEGENAIDEATGLSDNPTNTDYRTRVIITPFNLTTRKWGTPDVLEFNIPSHSTSTMRCDMNDVDFTAVPDEASGCILFGLVSCTKPITRRIKLERMKEGLFTTALRYQPNDSGHGRVVEVHSNISDFIGANHYEWKAVPFMVNRTAGGKRGRYLGLATAGMRGQNVIVNHFYQTANNTEGDLGERVRSWAPSESASVNEHLLIPDNDHLMNDNGFYEILVQPTKKDSDAVLVSWRYAGEGYQRGDKGKPIVPDDERTTVWSLDTSETGMIVHAPYDFKRAESFTLLGEDRGYAWLERNDRNTETKMYNVRVNDQDGTLRDYDKPVDLGYPDINGFGVFDKGNMIYGARVQEGKAAIPGDETLQQLKEIREAGGTIYGNDSEYCAVNVESMVDYLAENDATDYPVKRYQVIAARWDAHSHRYREFFPYASLEFAPDDLVGRKLPATGANKGGTCFLTTTVVDLGPQQANMHYVEVTPTLGFEFVSVSCFDGFVGEGTWTVHPRVQVVNFGNVPVSSFTVVFSRNGGELARVKLEHLEQYVCAPLQPLHEKQVEMLSAIEMDGESNGEVEFAAATGWTSADEAMIWPGNTRIYEVPLTVEISKSKGWGKTNPISVDVVDPCVPDLEKKDLQGNLLGKVLFDYETIGESSVDVLCGSLGSDDDDAFTLDYSEHTLGRPDEFVLSDVKELTVGGDVPSTGDGSSTVVAAGAAIAAAAAVAAGAAAAKRDEE